MEFPDGLIPLSEETIRVLESNGNRCSDWSRVKRSRSLDLSRIRNVSFSGIVHIGDQSGSLTADDGSAEPCGIYNSHIENCTIGNNVHISNISGRISSYIIEDEVIIRGCGMIATTGRSSFGNGVEVKVLNESGGRSVKIWDRLSSQMAYLASVCRDSKEVPFILNNMAGSYAAALESDKGLISSGSVLTDCTTITNVRFGPRSVVKGIMRLAEGSVNSTASAPCFIGHGSIMDRFIIASGSSVTDGCIIENCFIGQGCRIGKGFAAQDSLFFANSELLLGEACSIFAGPYTVSHHRSTLLIAGLFSFMNAGSGSNQSNHMYKTGPVHQGILERGSKTASDSYILWPALIGPFSFVSGRHYSHPDTSDFPFSYLIESEGESILLPGVNIKSAGLIRDIAKWPQRERRSDTVILDRLVISLHSPYSMGRMIKGLRMLHDLKKIKSEDGFYSLPGSVKIPEEAVEKGAGLYSQDIDKYIGNGLIRKLKGFKGNSVKELSDFLSVCTKEGRGDWTDVGGLLAPVSVIEKLKSEIERGRFSTPDELNKEFEGIHSRYAELEWDWLVERIESSTGKSIDKITPGEIITLINKCVSSVENINKLIYDDAVREYTGLALTGYGLCGTEDQKRDDFRNVRGSIGENKFIAEIGDHTLKKRKSANEIIKMLKQLKG